jgi:hypothetical protein
VDLAIVAEGARVSDREILLYDEIVRGEVPGPLRPARTVSAAAAMRDVREVV